MKNAFRVKRVDLETSGIGIAIMNKADAEDLDFHAMDRAAISSKKKSATAILDLTKGFVPRGTIGLFKETFEMLGVKDNATVYVSPKERPSSLEAIKEKMRGMELSQAKIDDIINDLMDEQLSDIELAAFITATYVRGLSKEETVYLANAIVNSGEVLKLKKKAIYDKHCIGGVVGNRTTLLVVPIVAAAGLTIPKTSSRAITSPAGTADTMEVLCNVNIGKEELERITNKAGGCIVWGGAINLAAADDKLIRIRHPLALDPRGMLLASILAKKKAVGAKHIIIDIPIGEGAKIKTKVEAKELAQDFKEVGGEMGMEIVSLITDGEHPIGRAVGASIEAMETLRILGGQDVSLELREKSVQLAGILLEIAGKAKNGRDAAMRIINSGKADKKFRQIIEAQGGDPEIKPEEIKLGKHSTIVRAVEAGRIDHINNRGISRVVRLAGAPQEKEAGLYLNVEVGDKVKPEDALFTLYSKSKNKLNQALHAYNEIEPIRYGKIILGRLE